MSFQTDFEKFERFAKNTIDKCRIYKKININGKTEEFTFHIPAGDAGYPSFWVRDAAMMVESGLIGADEIKGWLQVISELGQNGSEERLLKNEMRVPAWAIPDHINYDGGAVYFPSTYSSGNDQGDGICGFYPPHDDQYYFIEMGYIYYQLTGNTDFLKENFKGLSLIDRFNKAFESYNIDNETGLCTSNLPYFTVDWGFCDVIRKTGYLLFPSLLRYRAARRMTEFYRLLGRTEESIVFVEASEKIKASIISKFYHDSGWLYSSTGMGRQYDVWGTAFAVWVDILPERLCRKSCETLLKAFEDGIAVSKGYVRHILKGHDASDKSAWEFSTTAYNLYQNGGYWATPAGWYAYALSLVNLEAAQTMFSNLVEHTAIYEDKGAPFEWKNADDSTLSRNYYGTSAALPYVGVKRILKI